MLKRLSLVVSHRITRLIDKMRDKNYRDGYVAAHSREVLAKQMREFRGEMSQTEFAEKIGKKQTVVSRLENPSYVGWSLSTMFEIANRLDVAVFVRFVDFPTFLKLSEDMSADALHPHPYGGSQMDDLVKEDDGVSADLKFPFRWTTQPESPLFDNSRWHFEGTKRDEMAA
jgi:transcriptional regulator with XRE-family HTH domain